ncbi:MAG: hypothetical protein FWD36_10380 [Treponema sp.]|nr:hypothetical protein [Treponema sp.]
MKRILSLVLALVLAAGLLPIVTPASALPDIEQFQFEVTMTAGGTFSIPLSGRVNNTWNKPYNWNIDWGDGSAVQHIASTDTDAPQNEQRSVGIPHTYTDTGKYTITVTPAGSTDAWFAAFGFYQGTNGANVQTNRDMVTKVISPLTPLMTRTQVQVTGNSFVSHEWAHTFSGCRNLTMGEEFTFSDSWNNITRVGGNFAYQMFRECNGADFTMSEVFNLPSGIISTGNSFANSMFNGCSGDAFTMNEVFNLPTGITNINNYFAAGMFNGCSGDTFTMNGVFNLPAGITTGFDYFVSNMFNGCHGTAFTVNDVFVFPTLNLFVSDFRLFNGTFANLSNSRIQKRTIASIIGGNGVPSDYRGTFSGSLGFSDIADIHINWGGGFRGLTVGSVIIDSTTNDNAVINLTDETVILPSGFIVAAYSVNGGTKWKRGALPDAAKFPRLLNKGLTLHVTNNFDQKAKKPANGAQTITFPTIGARPKRNVEKLTPFYGDSHWVLAKKGSTASVFAGYEYAPSSNGKTPDGGVWLQMPEEGIPIASGSTRQSFLVRAAPNDNPTAASVPWRVRTVNFGKVPTLSIRQAKVNGSADRVAVIAFRKGDQYAIGDGDFTAALTVKTIIPVSQLSAQGTELRIRKAATGKKPPSEVQTITLPVS